MPAPSLVRRHPQASPRLKPLPTCGTSLNHGVYSRLLPFSHLDSRCRVVQGCPHMNLQGWYHCHHQHQPTLFQLAQLGVHHPGQQALCFYCLLLSIPHSKPLPANLTSPAPLLQGWSSRLSCNCQSPHQFSQHMNPLPIAPARVPAPTPLVLYTTGRPLRECVKYQMPTAKTIWSPVEPVCFAGLCRAMLPTEVLGFAGLCQSLSTLDIPVVLSVLNPSSGKFLKHCQLCRDPR